MESEALIQDPLDLDDNGFPLSGADTPPSPATSSRSSSFAAFYSSGADWSRLCSSSSSGGPVQRDLFQMWGIQKPVDQPPPPQAPNQSRQRSLLQMWGITKATSEGSVSVPPPPKRRRGVEAAVRTGPDGIQAGVVR